MIFLRSIQCKNNSIDTSAFPFSIPFLKTLIKMDFTNDITILVGENGTGKSTFLEALACSISSITIGDQSVQTDPTLQNARIIAENWKISWSEKTRKGFFMRAEDFFQYTKKMNVMKTELEEEIKRVDEEFKKRSKTAQVYARSGYDSQAGALESR
jgi:predicted ATPase